MPFPPGPVSPSLHRALVRNTGYLMSRCGAYAQRRFAQRLATIGLTPPMWGALNVLDAEGPVSQQRLGQAIGMDPSSMVGMIDELESRGLVQRRPHLTDRRAHALHVTAEGQRTLGRGRRLARTAQEELLAPLSEDDRRQLHALLLRVAEAAQDHGEPSATGRDGPAAA